MKKLVLAFVVALLTITITACPKNETPSPADFSIKVEKDSLSITIGEFGTNKITTKPKNGFSDPVNLKVVKKPAGVNVAFSPNPTTLASTLTITVSNTAIAGDYEMQVSGEAAGKTRFSKLFTLKIKEKVNNASFELAATAVTITKNSVAPNSIEPQFVPAPKGESTISISRKNNFAGKIHLTTQGLPPGVISTFTPNNTTGNTSTLKLTVAANVAAGTYQITVKGTSGTKTATTVFTLKIKEKPATPSFKLKAESVRIQKNSVLPAGINVNPKADTTIRITRLNGFDKAIRLDTENLPDGIKATFEPNDTKADKSKLTLELTGNVAAKHYTVTVKGSSGTITVKTTFELIIEDKPDNIKPTIVSTSPNNNDKGIKKDSKIVIEFSEAMNQAKTEAAFQLSGETVSFAWSADGKTMTVTPDDEFDYSDSSSYKYYLFTIGSDSQDLAGNKISTFKRVKFSTYRTLSKTLYSEKALDGWVTNTGIVDKNDIFMYAGDGNHNLTIRSFLSFDLTELPAETLEIKSASLFVYQHIVDGHPYDDLDYHEHGQNLELVIAHIYYGLSLEAKDFNFHYLDTAGNISDNEALGPKTLSATSWVKNDFAKRNQRHSKSQYVLHFPVATDNDNESDFAILYSSSYDDNAAQKAKRPRLDVLYLAP